MCSALISTLQWTHVEPQLVLNKPPHTITPGTSGSFSVLSATLSPYWHLLQTQSHIYKSLHNATAMAALPKIASLCNLAQ
jgi:hypothetical protein